MIARFQLQILVCWIIALLTPLAHANCDSLFGVELIDYRDDLTQLENSISAIHSRMAHEREFPFNNLVLREQTRAMNQKYDPRIGLQFKLDAGNLDFKAVHFFFEEQGPAVETFVRATFDKLARKFEEQWKQKPRSFVLIVRSESWYPQFVGFHIHVDALNRKNLSSTFTVLGDGTLLGSPRGKILAVGDAKDQISTGNFSEVRSVPRGFAPVLNPDTPHGIPDSSYGPNHSRYKRLIFIFDLDG